MDQLESYIEHSDIDRESGSKDDYSKNWGPAIEEGTKKNHLGIGYVLITGIRNTCERFLTSRPDKMEALLGELESRELITFKRLEFHLLRLFPANNKKTITDLLMSEEEYGEKQRLAHEYFLSAETDKNLLSAEQRKVIWSQIDKGGDVDKDFYLERCKEIGVEPSDEYIEKYKKNWQMYHLLPFKDIDTAWT